MLRPSRSEPYLAAVSPEAAALLKQHIRSLHPLDDAALQAFTEAWTEVSVPRRSILTRAGDTEHYLYFILEGIQRAVYEHEGREATLVFTYPPSFSGIVDSFLSRRPAQYHLEALTASRCMRLHFDALRRLLQSYPAIHDWMHAALANVLTGVLLRQAELQTANAETRFRALMQRSPHLLNAIPHKYLASYLGLDAATFSKLLGRVRID
jgi:CRP-like cAMP-binding protein